MNVPNLKILSDWCRARALRWHPTQPEHGATAMVLEPQDARRPWQRMMLILDDPEMRLLNEVGDTLATASDLPALLDAVDGGVGEPPFASNGGWQPERLVA